MSAGYDGRGSEQEFGRVREIACEIIGVEICFS